MIDRNSRPAITAVSKRETREPHCPRPGCPATPWASKHGEQWSQMGLPPGRAAAGPASDSQHVPHNGTLHGTRKSNAVPAGDRGAHPTQGEGWDGGSPGARPASLSVRRGVSSLPLSDTPWPLAL